MSATGERDRGTGIVAELHLAHGELPLRHALRAAPETTASLDTVARMETGETVVFVAVRGEGLDRFEAALPSDPSVADWRCVSDTPGERLYRIENGQSLLLGPLLAESDGRLLDLTLTVDGAHIEAQLPSREGLAAFRGACSEHGIGFDLRALYQQESTRSRLTDVQRETLLGAYHAGYFRDPRETDLEGLGRELGVSSTAVSRRLRRATERLVEAALLDGEAGAGERGLGRPKE